jgi:glycolate oxidase FAD binding subunit
MIATSIGTPTTAAAEIATAIADATVARAALRIVGASTWLDAGAPVRATRAISLERASGVAEYVPGDLVLTARAGTTMREIAAATGAQGQWLPLDPFGSADGTLGATVATASAGPLAHAFGGPRDLVLGVECVTGSGAIIRGGGRVTKNVAGFDLTRLLVGSWGTLGVITEISVRLRARPAVDTTIAIDMPDEIDALGERLRAVRAAPLEALAIELLDSPLGAKCGIDRGPVLLVRLGGNEDGVAAQRATLVRMGATGEVGAATWEMLRTHEPMGAWVWRMSDLPSRIADTWSQAKTILRAAGASWMHASVGRGMVRCTCVPATTGEGGLPDGERALIASLAASPFGGTIIYEKLPAEHWATLSPPAATDPVSYRIRAAFDPHSLLNPGILGAAAS